MTSQRLKLMGGTLLGAALGVVLLLVHSCCLITMHYLWQQYFHPTPAPFPWWPQFVIRYMVRGRLRFVVGGAVLGAVTAYTWLQCQDAPQRAARWCFWPSLLLFLYFLWRQVKLIVLIRTFPTATTIVPLWMTNEETLMACFDASLLWSLLLVCWGWSLHKRGGAIKTP